MNIKASSLGLAVALAVCVLLGIPPGPAEAADAVSVEARSSPPAGGANGESPKPKNPARKKTVRGLVDPYVASAFKKENQDHFFKQGPADCGAVALTFDDGPNRTHTPKLLEILKQEGAGATFFMVGQAAVNLPSTARAVADAGFEIGNHTHTHCNLGQRSPDQIRGEFRKSQDAIQKATGVLPRLHRPPYGITTNKSIEIAWEFGLETVHWRLDAEDTVKTQTAEIIAAHILKYARPGMIILLHDTHSRTIEAVPVILKGFREKGLKVITAGEMVNLTREDRRIRAEALHESRNQNID